MKRFSFNLDPALRLRRQQEEQAEIELAARRRELREVQDQLDELRREAGRHQSHRAALQSTTRVDLQAVTEAERYGEALTAATYRQEAAGAAAARVVDAALAKLRQHRQEREALERLREKRLEEHRFEAMQAEQNALDETAVLRWRKTD